MFRLFVGIVSVWAHDFQTGDEIRLEFSGVNGTALGSGEPRSVVFEITSAENNVVKDWKQSIVVGEGESQSEESKACDSGACDSNALLNEVFNMAEKPEADNLLFIRTGSSKRILLRLRDGTRLEGPVLGALFGNPENFLLHMKYQEIAEHPPAVRPESVEVDTEPEEEFEESIFSMYSPEDI